MELNSCLHSYTKLSAKLLCIAEFIHIVSHIFFFSFSFSLEGTPSTVDSLGVVRLLNRSFGHTWTPVANTKSQVC